MMEKSQSLCYNDDDGNNGMAVLKYTFMNDILFKMLFVKHPELLKKLVAAILKIPFESAKYGALPRTIVISILGFNLFQCEEYHSEFLTLEVHRHTPLTDKFVMHYFELPKIPKTVNIDNTLELWLSLFKAETEEELEELANTEVAEMKEAVNVYHQITITPEFRERERLYEKARHDEASALDYARIEGEEKEREKWQSVVAEKDALIAELRSRLDEDE